LSVQLFAGLQCSVTYN